MNLPIVVTLAVLALCLWLGGLVAYPHCRHFRYDERNPARRYCKHCNQLQEQYTHDLREGGWWEDMGSIRDPACVCHRYTENHP